MDKNTTITLVVLCATLCMCMFLMTHCERHCSDNKTPTILEPLRGPEKENTRND